jgi:hypothetical protein
MDVADAAGRSRGSLVPRHNALHQELAGRLVQIDSGSLTGDDARAVGAMRRALRQDLAPVAINTSTPTAPRRPDCTLRCSVDRRYRRSPSREVIEAFLGEPVWPAALLADMRRMVGPQVSEP